MIFFYNTADWPEHGHQFV